MPEVPLNAALAAARPRLVELMRAGIETKEPNTGWFRLMERASVFDGSYDWHSCVIAYFALSVEARVNGDEELEGWLAERLTPEALAAETRLLAERPPRRTATFPYDEAWFLMLLAERERRGADERVRAARLEVEGRLLDFLTEQDFPEGVAGAEYCGFYRSWLLAYLLVRASEPVGERAAERLAELRRTKLDPARDALRELDESHAFDFLWLPAILALIERIEDPPRPYDPGVPGELPETVTVPTVHPLGVTLSRLWPTAWDAGGGDADARARLAEHLDPFLAREDLWAGEFDACAHWLPQYTWLVGWFGSRCP